MCAASQGCMNNITFGDGEVRRLEIPALNLQFARQYHVLCVTRIGNTQPSRQLRFIGTYRKVFQRFISSDSVYLFLLSNQCRFLHGLALIIIYSIVRTELYLTKLLSIGIYLKAIPLVVHALHRELSSQWEGCISLTTNCYYVN